MRIVISGIYQIKCKLNNKEYIGSSEDIFRRFNRHKKDLFNNTHINSDLQNDYNKFGLHNFEFNILEKITDNLLKYEYANMEKSKNLYNKLISRKISLTDKQIDKFIQKIKILENDCWVYNGYKNIKDDYTNCNIGNRYYQSHRLSYWIQNPNFDETLLICHTCDNKYCCNPKHLFAGTQKENMKDLIDKGKGPANLNINIAKEIRELYREKSTKDIQNIVIEKYKILVSISTMAQILKNMIFYDKKYIDTTDRQNFKNQIKKLRDEYLSGLTITDLSKKYNKHSKTIRDICWNRTYVNIEYGRLLNG